MSRVAPWPLAPRNASGCSPPGPADAFGASAQMAWEKFPGGAGGRWLWVGIFLGLEFEMIRVVPFCWWFEATKNIKKTL